MVASAVAWPIGQQREVYDLTGLVGKIFIELQNTFPRDIQHEASSGTGGGGSFPWHVVSL